MDRIDSVFDIVKENRKRKNDEDDELGDRKKKKKPKVMIVEKEIKLDKDATLPRYMTKSEIDEELRKFTRKHPVPKDSTYYLDVDKHENASLAENCRPEFKQIPALAMGVVRAHPFISKVTVALKSRLMTNPALLGLELYRSTDTHDYYKLHDYPEDPVEGKIGIDPEELRSDKIKRFVSEKITVCINKFDQRDFFYVY